MLTVSRELITDFQLESVFRHNTQEITDVMVSQLAARGKPKKRILIAFIWPFFFLNFSLAFFRVARQLTEHGTAYVIS